MEISRGYGFGFLGSYVLGVCSGSGEFGVRRGVRRGFLGFLCPRVGDETGYFLCYLEKEVFLLVTLITT